MGQRPAYPTLELAQKEKVSIPTYTYQLLPPALQQNKNTAHTGCSINYLSRPVGLYHYTPPEDYLPGLIPGTKVSSILQTGRKATDDEGLCRIATW